MLSTRKVQIPPKNIKTLKTSKSKRGVFFAKGRVFKIPKREVPKHGTLVKVEDRCAPGILYSMLSKNKTETNRSCLKVSSTVSASKLRFSSQRIPPMTWASLWVVAPQGRTQPTCCRTPPSWAAKRPFRCTLGVRSRDVAIIWLDMMISLDLLSWMPGKE